VGLPADLTTYVKDEHRIALHRRIHDDDPYFSVLRQSWSDALRAALVAAPTPKWDD